jgi:hypothetical protein
MYELILVTPWPWMVAGPAIGLIVVLLAWVTGKGLGEGWNRGLRAGCGAPGRGGCCLPDAPGTPRSPQARLDFGTTER